MFLCKSINVIMSVNNSHTGPWDKSVNNSHTGPWDKSVNNSHAGPWDKGIPRLCESVN